VSLSFPVSGIPLVQTQDRTVNQLQQGISQSFNQLNLASQGIQSAINPILANPLVFGQILVKQVLTSGSNTINHGLDGTLQGWFIVRFHGAFAQIYDTQDSNPIPGVTLLLHASAGVTVDIYVF
jgi:hypothetical protein